MFKKKDRHTLNNSIDMLRIVIIMVFFCVAIFLFSLKLFDLQILKHEDGVVEQTPKVYKTAVLEMSRGHIYDRNGNTLVSNKKVFNIVVDKSTLSSEDYNTTLLNFIDLCEKNNIQLFDNLPLTSDYPYVLDVGYIYDDKKTSYLNKFIANFAPENHKFLSDDTALYDFLCEKYGISDEHKSDKTYRTLIAIRYEMDCNDFEYTKTCTLLSDVDEKFRTVISENLHNMHGISIVSEDQRYYNQGTLACHLLGRIGKMNGDESALYYKDGNNGYNYDDRVGKEGAEKAFESYLHGVDGVEELAIDEFNNIIDRKTVKEGKNGYSVYLTIDSDMQRVAEDALAEQIDYARRLGLSDTKPYNGEDCYAGSVVAMNPKTGEVYVLASYPGFDLNTFSEDFTTLNNDTTRRPLINRATQGIYPPGSTFKIATSIAALCEGIITPDTYITDKGVYTKYADRGYDPECWIYSNSHMTHGTINVKQAIEKSCNYFFYKVGDDMGIDSLTKYASLLGLGEETGIEIPESTGVLASPKYKDSRGFIWNPGDTLQAAIGQSDNVFTPLQLCSYMSAVINGGKRYKATLLSSVVDFYTGETVYETTPVVQSDVELPEDVVELVKSAMKSVVVDGTARNVFDDYPYSIGGKTGTAQISGSTTKNQSDTALFVGFAPYDDPEIVVSVIVEHGDQSARASEVAKAVFDYYFSTIEGNGE